MNIKKLICTTLGVKELTNLLGNNNIYLLHAKNPKPPYVEYEIIQEKGSSFSEGIEDTTRYKVQIDIFVDEKNTNLYTKIENTVKKLMIEQGFIRTSSIDLFENETKLYHKGLRFLIDIPVK